MGFLENLGRKFGMKRVPGAMRHEMADDRVADEREVANRVEDLVADELVLEAQGVVENARLAEHDRVLEGAAEREPVLPQHLDVLEEREGSCRRDLFDERFLGNAQRPRLMAKERMIVADAVGDLEVIGGIERDSFVATRHRNRPDDFQIPAARLLPLHARFVNQIDERRGTAIHDRHFGRVQLDDHVVHAHADERREQMFDRLDRHLVTRQTGGELNAREVVHRGRHLVIAQIGTAKPDAKIGRGGLQ